MSRLFNSPTSELIAKLEDKKANIGLLQIKAQCDLRGTDCMCEWLDENKLEEE